MGILRVSEAELDAANARCDRILENFEGLTLSQALDAITLVVVHLVETMPEQDRRMWVKDFAAGVIKTLEVNDMLEISN